MKEDKNEPPLHSSHVRVDDEMNVPGLQAEHNGPYPPKLHKALPLSIVEAFASLIPVLSRRRLPGQTGFGKLVMSHALPQGRFPVYESPMQPPVEHL